MLEVKNLDILFQARGARLHAVRGLSFQVDQGEILGVVGESGSGKSVTNMALLGLLPKSSIVTADCLKFEDQDLLKLNGKQWQLLRGKKISMIFQDPMSALNPVLPIETQLTETLRAHMNLSKLELHKKCIQLLGDVGISSPEERLGMYPFELSGGMCQRVMIAIAISCSPQLLVADEPTTALDVTIQKQILELLKHLQTQLKMSVILVTHDLALVSQYAHRIQVMYAGEIVESGSSHEIIHSPRHPYTEALIRSRPGSAEHQKFRQKLKVIPGMVPSLIERPMGCQFMGRCQYKTEKCGTAPLLENESRQGQNEIVHSFRCYHPLNLNLKRDHRGPQ